MTERKFKSYSLWMKWQNLGWKVGATCKNLPWPAANPRVVLERWMRCYEYGYWVRGKTWLILPVGKKPKGVK